MKKNSEGTLWSINDNIPIFDSDQTGNSWLTDNYPSMMGFFNSLTASGGHDHQLFDNLLWWLVTSTIFVRC